MTAAPDLPAKGCYTCKLWKTSCRQVLPFMHSLIGPRGWSYTELSRIVALPFGGGAAGGKDPRGQR